MTNDTYDDLANSISNAIRESSSLVSSSVKDIANKVTHGTRSISHAVALSEEDMAPESPKPREIRVPEYIPQAPQLPTSYTPQAPQEGAYEPVLTRLQRLRA